MEKIKEREPVSSPHWKVFLTGGSLEGKMRGRGFQEQKRPVPGFAAQSLLVTTKGNNPREKMAVSS